MENFEIMVDNFAQEDFWMAYGGESQSSEAENFGEGWEEF